MSLIPAERLRALRNDVPVLAVISELDIPLKMRGMRPTFRCPGCTRFHTATKPATNLARCFKCERNFNPIDLVMAERGWSFLEAVKYLERLAPSTFAAPPPQRRSQHLFRHRLQRAGSQQKEKRRGPQLPRSCFETEGHVQ